MDEVGIKVGIIPAEEGSKTSLYLFGRNVIQRAVHHMFYVGLNMSKDLIYYFFATFVPFCLNYIK